MWVDGAEATASQPYTSSLSEPQLNTHRGPDFVCVGFLMTTISVPQLFLSWVLDLFKSNNEKQEEALLPFCCSIFIQFM